MYFYVAVYDNINQYALFRDMDTVTIYRCTSMLQYMTMFLSTGKACSFTEHKKALNMK